MSVYGFVLPKVQGGVHVVTVVMVVENYRVIIEEKLSDKHSDYYSAVQISFDQTPSCAWFSSFFVLSHYCRLSLQSSGWCHSVEQNIS